MIDDAARLTFECDQRDAEAVRAIAKQRGVPVAEVLREAVAALLELQQRNGK